MNSDSLVYMVWGACFFLCVCAWSCASLYAPDYEIQFLELLQGIEEREEESKCMCDIVHSLFILKHIDSWHNTVIL